MIYLFLILVAIALLLLKLGALSVWFTVLSAALIAVAVVVFAVAIYALWKRFRSGGTRLISYRKP